MRSESGEAEFGGVFLNDVPDYPLGHPVAPAFPSATDTSKHPTAGQTSCTSPNIEHSLHPLWYRNGSNVAALADKIDDGPVLFPLLKMPEIQIRQLASPEPASKQNGKHCAVSLSLERIWVRCLPEAASFFSREPVSDPHAELLDSLYTSDTGGQFGAEQARVGRFVGETPNGSESSVDCSGRELPVFKVNPVSCNDSLVEGQSRFGAIPVDELIDGVSIPSLRLGRREAVKDRGTAVI